MGHKQSVKAHRVEDRTNYAEPQVRTSDKVIRKIKKVPMKYFGGQAVVNDPSMHRLQQDLLAFDETVKTSCSPRRRRREKSLRQQTYVEDEDDYPEEQYYDCNDRLASGGDDDDDSHIYVNVQPSVWKKDPSWRCRYCASQNKLTIVVCRQCGELTNRF